MRLIHFIWFFFLYLKFEKKERKYEITEIRKTNGGYGCPAKLWLGFWLGFRSSNGARRMKIVVERCMHGDLDNVYRTLQQLEKFENTKIDLLLCWGDFQAVRNEHDLKSLNVPLKFRSTNSFWKYCSGAEVAPYPPSSLAATTKLPIISGNCQFTL